MAGQRLVAVAPNPSIDRLLEVAEFHRGEIHRPVATTVVPGGKGFNVARSAAALGALVTAVGPLAGFSGRWIADQLAGEGLDVNAVWIEGETRTCTSILDRSDGSMTEAYETGETMAADDWRLLLDAFGCTLEPPHLGETGLITVSGSLPPGVRDEGLAQLVRIAKAAGVRIAIDGHGAPLTEALAAGPWLAKVNLDEARGVLGDPEISAAAAVRGLIAAGANSAIVTLGRDGAVVSLENGTLIRVIPPAVGIHTVGAGDAFLGGLATGLLRGEGLREAAISASAAAAASTMMPGAGRLDVADATRLRGEVTVEVL